MGIWTDGGLITSVNQYGEADTVRDNLAAKDNDDVARWKNTLIQAIPLSVE